MKQCSCKIFPSALRPCAIPSPLVLHWDLEIISNLEKLDIFKLASGSSLYQENVTQGPNTESRSSQERTGTLL